MDSNGTSNGGADEEKSKLLQSLSHGIPAETLRLALTVAQAMKDKNTDDCQALLQSMLKVDYQPFADASAPIGTPSPDRSRHASGEKTAANLKSEIQKNDLGEKEDKEGVDKNATPQPNNVTQGDNDIRSTRGVHHGAREDAGDVKQDQEPTLLNGEAYGNGLADDLQRTQSSEDDGAHSGTGIEGTTHWKANQVAVVPTEQDMDGGSLSAQSHPLDRKDKSGLSKDRDHDALPSSDDDLPPSTPASGQSSESELTEPETEKKQDQEEPRQSLGEKNIVTPENDDIVHVLVNDAEEGIANGNMDGIQLLEGDSARVLYAKGIGSDVTESLPIVQSASIPTFGASPVPSISSTPFSTAASSLTSSGVPFFSSTEKTFSAPILPSRESVDMPQQNAHDSSLESSKSLHTSQDSPLYYQPQIVMHGQVPALLFCPVIARQTSLNKSSVLQLSQSPQGLEGGGFHGQAGVPLIVPLGSPSLGTSLPPTDPGSALKEPSPLSQPLQIVNHQLSDNTSEASSRVKSNNGLPYTVDSSQDRTPECVTSSCTESETEERPTLIAWDDESFPCDSTNSSITHQDCVLAYDMRITESGNSKMSIEERPPLRVQYSTKDRSNPPTSTTADFLPTNPFAQDVDLTTDSHPQTSNFDSGARPKTMTRFNPFAADPSLYEKEEVFHHRTDFRTIPKSVRAEKVPTTEKTSGPDTENAPRPQRKRISSDSMVTLLETSFVIAEHPVNNETMTTTLSGSSPTTLAPSTRVVNRNEPTTEQKRPEAPLDDMPGQFISEVGTSKTGKRKPKLPGQIAPLWVPDEHVDNCANCYLRFNLVRRRHHCRGCGRVFCSDCCSQLARLAYMQYQIARICVPCTNRIKEVLKGGCKNDLQVKGKPKSGPQKPTAINSKSPQGRKSNSVISQPGRARTCMVTQDLPPPNTAGMVTQGLPPPNPAGSSQQFVQQPITYQNQAPTVPGNPPVIQPQAFGAQMGNSINSGQQFVFVPTSQNFQPGSIVFTDPVTGKIIEAPVVYPSMGAPQSIPIQPVAGGNIHVPQVQATSVPLPQSVKMVPQQPSQGISSVLTKSGTSEDTRRKIESPSQAPAVAQGTFTSPTAHSKSRLEHVSTNPASRERGTSMSPTPISKELEGLKMPLRPAGRTVSWRGAIQCSKLKEQRKSLAKDLRDLPNGVIIQAAEELQIIVKKVKLKDSTGTPRQVWFYCSSGLRIHNQLEIVIMLQCRPKEDIFPEEVLRIYRAVLDLVKQGTSFNHSNYLAFNSPFLDTMDNAAFIFVADHMQAKPAAVHDVSAPFLYGILVKRPEIVYAMYTPTRFLLRIGQEAKDYPFPVLNNRDRTTVYDGFEQEDTFYSTTHAMNKYLKNSVPEALIPGVLVLKEGAKVVLQVPVGAQTSIVSLFDRLIVKNNQTATIPLLSDINPHADAHKVFHQGVATDQVLFGKSVCLFQNPAIVRQSGCSQVTGLGFLILHLGVDAASPLHYGGELIDDGALLYLSKTYTQKIRQSLYERSNCYFYLGDRFDIEHFQLRWSQDPIHTLQSRPKLPKPSPVTEQPRESYPGTAVVDIKHAGYQSELDALKSVVLVHVKYLIDDIEQRIRKVCVGPLMLQANRMKAGEVKELQLRFTVQSGSKKWAIGPGDQPTALIRSLQMALHAVTLPEVYSASLGLSFDVTIRKE